MKKHGVRAKLITIIINVTTLLNLCGRFVPNYLFLCGRFVPDHLFLCGRFVPDHITLRNSACNIKITMSKLLI